jgi:hypothetical protein
MSVATGSSLGEGVTGGGAAVTTGAGGGVAGTCGFGLAPQAPTSTQSPTPNVLRIMLGTPLGTSMNA